MHAAGPKMRKWYGQESSLPRDGGEQEPAQKQVRVCWACLLNALPVSLQETSHAGTVDAHY
jgi:hypothetical protein